MSTDLHRQGAALASSSHPEARRARVAWLCGFALGLPLYVQVIGTSLSWAQGHVEARQQGFYLPVLAPIAAVALVVGTGPAPSMAGPRLVLRRVSGLLVIVMCVAYLYGSLTHRRDSGSSDLLLLLQACAPIALMYILAGRKMARRDVARLIHGFEFAVLASAGLLFAMRWTTSYDPRIGYPDDLGPIGVPTSLRFFPTLVAASTAMCATELVIDRVRSGRGNVFRAAGITAGFALIYVSHSRTALVGCFVAVVLLISYRARRSALATSFVCIGVAILVIAFPRLPTGGSGERLLEGSGASDVNRMDKVVESFEQTFNGPFGLAFVPSDSDGLTNARVQRVVTAENQLGTFGASAGPAALVLGGILIGFVAYRAYAFSRSTDGIVASVGIGGLVLASSCLWQITATNAHLGLVFAVTSWLVVHELTPLGPSTAGRQTDRHV